MDTKETPGERASGRPPDLLLAAVLCSGLLTTACAEATRHARPADDSGAASEAAPNGVPVPLPGAEAASPPVPGLDPVARPDEQLLIFELRWKDVVLNEAMIGYLDGARVLLPLAEVARSLDFPISVNLGAGLAQGWFLAPNRVFHLDLARREVVVEGRRSALPEGMAELQSDDIFVDARMFEKWFPIDLEVQISSLQVAVTGREPLPIEARQARAKRREGLSGHRTGDRSEYAQLEMPPYRALSWPNIDLSTEHLYRKNEDGSDDYVGSYNVFATGDLLYLDSEIFVGGDDEYPFSDARLTFGRKDPDGGLLGPLAVTEFAGGDIFTPQVPLISRQQLGRGAEISSFPLLRPTEFDRVTLRGDLPLGWEVELFRNEVLLDFQLARPDGLYEFVDVPLVYGLNVVRLAFHGPQGQKREELQRLLVGSGLVRPGELHFRLAGNQHDEVILPVDDGTDPKPQDGEARGFAEFELGITRNLSVAAGLSTVPLESERRNYGSLGLRGGLGNVFGRLDLVGDDTGGGAGKVALQSQFSALSLLLEHSEFQDFVSEQVPDGADLLVRRSSARLDGLLDLPLLPHIPFALTGGYESRESGSDTVDATNRLSTTVNGLSLSNNLDWHWDNVTGSDTSTLTGAFLVGGRYGPFHLRGELDYGLKPDQELVRAAVTADWAIDRNFGARLGVQRLESEDRNTVSAGINRRFDSFSLGLDLEASDDGSFLTRLSLSTGFGLEPRGGGLHAAGRGMAGRGAMSPRVFLDRNLNDEFDDGDQLLEGVRFKVNGAKAEHQTGADGTAFLTHLGPYQHLDLGLASGSLEDPYWTARQNGVSVVLRPGSAVTAEFPIVTTGEIDGTALLWRDGTAEPVSDVKLQLLGPEGDLVKEAETVYDGFYLFDFVPPGRYTLRIDPDQMARLQLEVPPVRSIVVDDGAILNGVDFVLHPGAPTGKARDQMAAAPAAEPDRAAPGAEAPRPAAAATGYQVQVGAYSSRARAERAWALVMRSAQGLLDGLSREVVKTDLGQGRDIVYRLRVGPLQSRAAARKLCFELRARSIACFVAPPPQGAAHPAAKPRTEAQAVAQESPAAAEPSTRPAYQVQLGAYRSMARARRAWTRIARSANGLLDHLSGVVVEADLGEDKGIYYRLLAGPLPDRTAGMRLCAELEVSGIDCFVAPPSETLARTAVVL
jgi:cell division septation protein DedD